MNKSSAFFSFEDEENNSGGWQAWNDTSNPDTASPWSWSFDFPNSTGYYEFYSIGSKIGSTDEAAPVYADTICYYNASADNRTPPGAPTITGPASGKVGDEHEYTFKAVDPDGQDVHLWIDWGDDTNSGWIGLYESGAEVKVKHTWAEKGDYTIRAKAKDTDDLEGLWGTLKISMPRNRLFGSLFLRLLERLLELFPNAFPIFRHLLEL